MKKHQLHTDGKVVMNRRMDRPGRARGGSVGADMHPLTSAANVSPADKVVAKWAEEEKRRG